MYYLRSTSHLLINLVFILSVQLVNGNSEASFHSENVLFRDSYEFIIVGGGTSGCVLANRLSEKYTVLVLEEGGFAPDDFNIPAKVMGLYSTPSVKHYMSIPQKNAGLEWDNGRVDFMIGRVLGGGSQVNTMVFNRGSPHDYDNWAEMTGDTSWKYENLMKYFKRTEDYHGNFPGDQHGKGGPIPISESKYAPGLEALMEAGEFYGYPSRKDPNGPQIPSFAPIEFPKRMGRRVSAFKGYLQPLLGTRPQLTVLTNATVRRIIFDSSKTRAVGVTFSLNLPQPEGNSQVNSGGSMTTNYVQATKEIIISAGAMDSPAILMRSGIGPEDVLEASNIPLVKSLPVGLNLHDHVLLRVDFMVDRNTPAGVFIAEEDLNPTTWKEYLETGDGPYSSLSGMHGQAFWVSGIRLKEPFPSAIWADVQLLHYQSAENVKPEDTSVNIYTLPFLTRPKSRGRVTLNSSDVDAMPLIDFQYLSDPEGHDMQIFLEAVKLSIEIYENAPSFKEQGCRLKNEPDDKCVGVVVGGKDWRYDDEYWKCFIRRQAQSGIHAGGTCRMGRGKEAVVDTRLKVIGIEGLRVVDMSVVPQVTNANTHAVAYVIAEKAAEMIKEDWFEECTGNLMGGSAGGGDQLNFCF